MSEHSDKNQINEDEVKEVDASVNLPANQGNKLPSSSLDSYIHYANSQPMLTKEEEHELALDLQETGNKQAAQKLVLSHIRYVARVARGYMGYGLNLSDLVQEGTVGLMKAVKKFKPEKDVRLVTFAMHWIKAEIHEFIIRNWRMVKIATTKSQRKLFFKLRSKKKDLTWLKDDEIAVIANDLGVREKDVVHMEKRMSSPDSSLELPDNDDDKSFAPIEFLEDKSSDPSALLAESNWQDQIREGLESAFAKLDDRSRDIIASRWMSDKKTTLDELALKYDISKERVRQIEAKALSMIRDEVIQDESKQ